MNYFLINSNQLQLFDVEEAVEKFNLDRKNCVIIVRKSYENASKIAIKRIEHVTFFYNWKNIEFLEFPKVPWSPTFLRFPIYLADILFYRNKVKKIISHYGTPTKIFLGNYKNEGMRDIANSYKNQAEIIFMDEGNTTIQYLQQRNQYLKANKKDNKLSNIIKQNVFSLSVDHPNYFVKYFTVYDGPSNDATEVIKHHYENNRSRYLKSFNRTNESVFIASILVEFKIVSRSNYVKLLKSIKLEYGEFIYFAHPKEKDEDLDFYEKELGVSCKRLDVPIELYFLKNSQLYSNLITFQSSAIINLSKIFGNIISYKIIILPEEFIEKEKDKKQLKELYENFKKYDLLEVVEV